MKLSLLAVTMFLCVSAASISAQPTSREPGFSGQVMLGAVFLSTEDSLSTSDDNELIESIDQSPQSFTQVVPGLIGEVTYTFDSGDHQLFVGLNRVRIVRGSFAPEVGYRYSYGRFSKVEVAYLPTTLGSDAWSDPFVTGEDRAKTSRDTDAFRIRAAAPLGAPVSFEYAQGSREIAKDRSGESLLLTPEQRALLLREADLSHFSIDTMIPINQQFRILPNLYYYEEDALGAANDFSLYGAELGFTYRTGRHFLVANVSYEQSDFDTVNPVFDKVRTEEVYGLFAMYQFSEPFGLEDTRVMALMANRMHDSNIPFYEKESLVVGAGLLFIF
jgi:hypothetical protein